MKDQNKISGGLVGGAIGDALGFPIEFCTEEEIYENYGKDGISDFVIDPVYDRAIISDDTQLTLFTAEGLLRSQAFYSYRSTLKSLYAAYQAWLRTQYPSKFRLDEKIWLCWLPEINQQRAPGLTCISSLNSGTPGDIDLPVNNSKGCGGVMRVAPIGMFYAPEEQSIEETDMLGAGAAALTHGHPLGYIPAAGLVHIVNRAMYTDMPLYDIVQDMIRRVPEQFRGSCENECDEFRELIEKAVELARRTEVNDPDAIHQLGAGWCGDEALAIAVYCALRHENDFDAAIRAAVNHGGDSDSTGSITGNIIGTYLGYQSIPEKYIRDLELHDVILKVASELAEGMPLNWLNFPNGRSL